MRVRIGKEKENENTAVFQGVSNFDYDAPLTARTPDEEFLNNATQDPGLIFTQKSLNSKQLALAAGQAALSTTLRQQQYLVYDIASQVGVLSPYVGATQNALKAFDVILSELHKEQATAEAITTGIGVATKALSAIPTIYTQIASAIVGIGLWIADLFIEYKAEIPPQVPALSYSKTTDLDQFNVSVRDQMTQSWDWTPIFLPRFKGQLSAQVQEDQFGRLVLAFALGDGEVARVDVTGSGKKRKTVFPDEGIFNGGGGLGMIPGGERILSIVQVTSIKGAVGPSHNHATIFDPRCGSIQLAEVIDIGSWYPVTAQGAVSLWDMIWQRGASMYTIDPVICRQAWANYFDSIWNGVDRIWGRTKWQGNAVDYGWGCGFFQDGLNQLIHNYTVSSVDGNVGGTMAWGPQLKTDNYLLGSSDEKVWDRDNAYTNIIKPALDKLREAQIWYLENTTMAAYLPIEGGKDADPLAQAKPMGCFARKDMRERFVKARHRILNGSAKYDVRLRDVLDPIYRAQIENAGGGTQALELWLTARMPGEPSPFAPEGGIGLGTPDPRPTIHPPVRAWPYVASGLGVTAATAAAYYFWDDLKSLVSMGRSRLPRRLR